MKRRLYTFWTAFLLLLIGLSGTAAFAETCLKPTSEIAPPSEPGLSVIDDKGRERLLYEESHALLIGNAAYAQGSGWRTLSNVPHEMDALSAALKAHGFHVVRFDNLMSTDFAPVVECFVRSYGYRRDARIVIYFAGHGFTREDIYPSGTRTVGYVLPVDSAPEPDAPGSAQETAFLSKAIRLTQFVEWASAMEARHVLLFFDSCFSGSILGHRGPAREEDELRRPRPLGYALSDQAQSPIRWFVTAGTARQPVPAESIFNQLLVQVLLGLRPEADVNRDNFVSSGELVQFLKGSVPISNPAQTPDDGRIRDSLLDIGDMMFKVPGREVAQSIEQAAANARMVTVQGTALDANLLAAVTTGGAAAAPAISALNTNDQNALAKAVADLESATTTIRREARSTLSSLVAKNGAPFAGELVRGIPHGSYRYQLGVTDALARVPSGWTAAKQDDAKKILQDRFDRVTDPTLKGTVSGALRNARP